jgi:hypothetical protein
VHAYSGNILLADAFHHLGIAADKNLNLLLIIRILTLVPIFLVTVVAAAIRALCLLFLIIILGIVVFFLVPILLIIMIAALFLFLLVLPYSWLLRKMRLRR